MKLKLNYLLYILIIVCSSTFALAQVGIGTNNPDPSSSLDVYSNSKGILFPKYDLVDVFDAVSPVNNPAEGLQIYNIGTHLPKGYYIWINHRWNIVITAEQVNRVLFLNSATNEIVNTTQRYIINQSPTNNVLKNMSLVTSNDPANCKIDNDTETITLPAGKYKVFVGGDVINITISNETFTQPSNPDIRFFYRSYNCYLKSTTGTLLSPAYYDNRLFAGSFASYSWVHYIDLPTTTSFKIYIDTASDTNSDQISPRTGLSVIIYELKD